MKDFYYVYILVSETDGETHYTGITRDLTARLSKHNQGACVRTSKNRPWKIEIAIAFRSETKARRFERYFKTGPFYETPRALKSARQSMIHSPDTHSP
jgi:predicted GIY-YIG superfamily endonuclease